MWAVLVEGGSMASYKGNVFGQQGPVLTKHSINARKIMPSQIPVLLLLPLLNHVIYMNNGLFTLLTVVSPWTTALGIGTISKFLRNQSAHSTPTRTCNQCVIRLQGSSNFCNEKVQMPSFGIPAL